MSTYRVYVLARGRVEWLLVRAIGSQDARTQLALVGWRVVRVVRA